MLTPSELVRRAASRGVRLLALTDHDETGGLDEARSAAAACGIGFVGGVEISSTWSDRTVHVVGLGIDAQAAPLADGLARIRGTRAARAEQIASRLDTAGIHGSLDGALRHAGASGAIGRSHFARFLVERRYVRNANEAFRLYLGAGRLAYVSPAWPAMPQAVEWIKRAGGCAVLAHPDRYRLPPRLLRALFADFAQAGGDAVEISAGERFGSSPLVRLARAHGLTLSSGSDFHAPGGSVADLGDAPAIPEGLPAVWQRLRPGT